MVHRLSRRTVIGLLASTGRFYDTDGAIRAFGGSFTSHDLFIQLMKLKNTLRHLRGEELITHLGWSFTTETRHCTDTSVVTALPLFMDNFLTRGRQPSVRGPLALVYSRT